MKYFVDGVIVLEGKADVSWLKTFIDAPMLITNGLDVNNELLTFLKIISKDYKIIVMSDPDKAGETIRAKIISNIEKAIPVIVDINKCNKNNKHGVAECLKEEIIEKLSPFFKNNALLPMNLTKNDLFSLGLNGGDNSSKLRNYIIEKYQLGESSQNEFLLKLNLLKIDKETLKEDLKQYGN